MFKDQFIKENRVNYIIAKPANGRTPFLNCLIKEYESGMFINLKPEKKFFKNEKLKYITFGLEVDELVFTQDDVLIINHATLLGYYNNSVINLYKELKYLNRKYKTTIICIESFLTFEKNMTDLKRNADRIIELHREYYYSRNIKDKDKLQIRIHDNIKKYDIVDKKEIYYNFEKNIIKI